MKKIKFYNVKTKKKFTSGNYKLVKKKTKAGKRYFAIVKNGGINVHRIVSAEFYKTNK